jgi:hypothetical protein
MYSASRDEGKSPTYFAVNLFLEFLLILLQVFEEAMQKARPAFSFRL